MTIEDDKLEAASKLDILRTNAVAILTLASVLIYGGGALYALITTGLTFKEFSAALGPLTGVLVGYWAKGAQTSL